MIQLKDDQKSKVSQEKLINDEDDEEYEDLEHDENLFGKIIIKGRSFIFNQLKRVRKLM